MKTVKNLLENKISKIYAIIPSAKVFDAIEMMSDKGVGALLIMEDEKLLGIISERDYARRVILKNKLPNETIVESVMSRDLICVSMETTINECMTLMTEKKVRHLPVLKNKKVLGVISIGDVVRAVISEQENVVNQLTDYIRSG